jgi:hypothetical protein
VAVRPSLAESFVYKKPAGQPYKLSWAIKSMRHRLIHKKAQFIDQLIDYYKAARGRHSFPHKEVGHLVQFLFPGSVYKGRGAFKTVHKISSQAKDLALKTSH